MGISLILGMLFLATSIWVYLDVRKKGNHVKGVGPWGWLLACSTMWIIFFPYYLLNRGKSEVALPLGKKFSEMMASSGQVPASKGKRLAAGLIDMVVIPIVLGIVIGLVLLAAPDMVRSIVLVLVNILWLVFRDAVYSPGRAMIKTKIFSLTGAKVTIIQAYVRNLLLIVPFVLVLGYLLEIVWVLWKNHRVMDIVGKTQVVEA